MKPRYQGVTLNRVHNNEEYDEDAVREEFVHALDRAESAYELIQRAVLRAIDLDVSREELIAWGVEAGKSEKWVRSVLSSVLIQFGKRLRAPGAGPKPPREAVALARSVLAQYPETGVKILRAALRWAVAHQKRAGRVVARGGLTAARN